MDKKPRNRNSCANRTTRKKKVNNLELCAIENRRQLNRRIAKAKVPAKVVSRSISAVECRFLYCLPGLEPEHADQMMRNLHPRAEYKGRDIY